MLLIIKIAIGIALISNLIAQATDNENVFKVANAIAAGELGVCIWILVSYLEFKGV